jgi:hypothetical protein
MSAIPLRRELPTSVLLEISNADLAIDPFQDRLISQGYEVVSASSYQDALALARHELPAIIILNDNPANNLDAVKWIEFQHRDRISKLAMTPLVILADSGRAEFLKGEELPDRILVVQRRADTLNQLTRIVKRLMRVWDLD